MAFILSIILAFAAVDSSKLIDEQNLLQKVDDQNDSYFLFNETSKRFEQVPQTQAAVDSLLQISSDELDYNSGIAFNAARQALLISTDIDYKEGMARAHNLVGIKYMDFGDHEMAHFHYLNAMELEAELGNTGGIASILNNISRVYTEQENYEEGVSHLEASRDAYIQAGDKHQTLITSNNLGVIHRRQGEYDKALDFFWKVANNVLLQGEEPDSLLYTISVLNIGNTYRNKKNFQRAKIHLQSAREYLERHEHTHHLIYTDTVLGKLYKELGDQERGLKYAKSALDMAKKNQFRERVKEAYLLISEIHEEQGEYTQAFEYFKLYHQISDTLQTMQRGERIKEIQTRFDVEQKEKEIALLNKEAALQEAKIIQQEHFRGFLLFGVLLLLIIVGLLVRSNYQRKKNNLRLRESRLEIEKQNNELCELNKEMDEFLSIAAHDLRNPLSSINMAVDLINSESKITRKTLQEYTEMIKKSSARMLHLINDVLKTKSAEACATSDNIKKLEANQLVKKAVKHFQKPAEKKSIELRTHLTRDETIFLGDADNVLRIFENLISNAIKFSPPETSVIVSTWLNNKKVYIAIEDQGPGINPNDKKKLFGKYSRLSNKPTGNESSTGLGLFIVKKITESMGGRVWCESEENKGAKFIVELPAPKQKKSGLLPGSKKRKKPAVNF